MNELFVVRLTLISSVVIVTGLIFTHFFAGHKIKGLFFAALGLTCSTIGYGISTLIPPQPGIIYLSNMFIMAGVTLFYVSTQRILERKVFFPELVIFVVLVLSLLAVFQFAFPLVMIRQITVSLALIYVSLRQVFLLYRYVKIHVGTYLFTYLILSCVTILLQTIRLFFIGFGINNLLVPNLVITYNSLILITNAVIFGGLALFLVVSSSLKMRNQLLEERQLLEEWSTTDYLTRMPNRRKLYDFINSLIQKNTPFAVVITDLDGFKYINDQYGHPVGDAVLKGYADEVSSHKPSELFVARFGGDEFVYVIPNYTDESSLIEKIIISVNLHNLVVDNKKFNFELRSSAGVALYPFDGTTISELLKKADHALYLVKTTNRNSVGFYKDLK